MSDTDENFRFSLKAMLNRDESKVLFVEADNHFIDVLLSFLTMPLGKILGLLHKHYGDEAPSIGSLTSLYRGLQNLGSDHFCTEGCKRMLLNPRNSSEALCRRLKLDVDDEHIKYLICGPCLCPEPNSRAILNRFFIKANDSVCTLCGEKNSCSKLNITESNAAGNAGVFTETASFIVFDDFRIVHNSKAFPHIFSSIGKAEIDGARPMKVSFGFNEIMDLLKGLFLSKTPLSDIILKDRCPAGAKQEPRVLFSPFVDEAVSESKKMKLEVMVQKSTNKFLFAQAEEDLVDFLFSFLAIPLGGVASLLQGDTSVTNIDYLYTDVVNSIPDKYLRTPDIKDRLIKPKLCLYYLSSNQILPLDQETLPPVYLIRRDSGISYVTVKHNKPCNEVDSFKSPRGHENYVRGPRTYMVTDDLEVTEFSIVSSFSIMHRLNIPMSDVQQVDLLIGVPEGLRILKASLASNSALTNALLKPMVKKEPKQEN